jgi:hypothetical protein
MMTADGKNPDLIGGSPLVHARVSGLVGLVVLGSGSFAGIVAGRLILRGDVAGTSRNILASESLYRLGIVASLGMMIAWLFYALLLHRLLRRVHRWHAMTMLLLVVAAVPIYMLAQANLVGALLAAAGQQPEQVKLFLELHRFGSLVAAVFFGLWLFPLGLLVFNSGFLPRFLGLLLMAGTLGYLVLFVQAFLFPGFERTPWTNPFLALTHASELALLLWLLAKGVNVERWEQRAGAIG